ncbi:MAG: glycosyltransferase family A protein [Flavobacteriaceae bacterium]|nr:glycosyltransferase family A protein [Flavobacteriaceae bacterium]
MCKDKTANPLVKQKPKVSRFTQDDVQILVATMHRDSTAFLDRMFMNSNWQRLNLLIVNQTTSDKILSINNATTRVINSFEKGISKSRNLALYSATKPILLLADDDTVFIKDAVETIAKAYNEFKTADFICFQTKTFDEKLYWKYPTEKGVFPKHKYGKILSIEMSFRSEFLKENSLKYNEQFGLGGRFEDGENRLMIEDLYKKNAQMMFYPKPIVYHASSSSSDELQSDRWLYARTALDAKLYPRWQAEARLLKRTLSIWRNSYIGFSEIPTKIKLGLQSLKDLKRLNYE